MQNYRVENDALGEKKIPAEALYGIHTQRAMENFPLSGRSVSTDLLKAYGLVKLACARTNQNFNIWSENQYSAIEQACQELSNGNLSKHILVDALQGGAGTSTNMNINEVICNRALQILNETPGDYDKLHPLDDINRHQSTNDTYPTALKLASIQKLRILAEKITALQETFQRKEQEFADVVKIGRTQLQDAVLTTLGRSMSAFAEALSRDRWRIYKCEERLRVINLGGTAIGSGLGAPRDYIFRVTEELKQITGIGFARAENLVEVTQNADVYVEVSGMLSACAANLQKIANDLRWMASGPQAGLGEINLPPRQAGSSIMPGKVNPVIPEAVIQASLTVNANHQKISQTAAMGNFELNAFLPLIADALLESINLLINSCVILKNNCVDDIQANRGKCRLHIENSTATLTAIIGKLGYEKLSKLAAEAIKRHSSVKECLLKENLLSNEEFESLISPEQIMSLGEKRK